MGLAVVSLTRFAFFPGPTDDLIGKELGYSGSIPVFHADIESCMVLVVFVHAPSKASFVKS